MKLSVRSLLSLTLIIICFCLFPSRVFAINSAPLLQQIQTIEKELEVSIGVSVYKPEHGVVWSYHGDQRFPMMSTFKTLACAKMLVDADKGTLNQNDLAMIKPEDLIAYSPVLDKLTGKSISLNDACQATLQTSDNTAANLILEKIGGPSALTLFMRTMGDNVTRLDRNEPELNEGAKNDLRDTTTPNAMSQSLSALMTGTVLSDSSRVQLENWMENNKVADELLRSVLPKGYHIADRTGAGGFGSRGIIAFVWSENTESLIIVIYLTQTEASIEQRNQAIVKIGKNIFDTFLIK